MSVSFSARIRAHGDEWAMPVEHLEDLNVCNGNAAHLLGLLELRDASTEREHDAELTGEVPATEFAERVALAEALDLAGARPGFTDGRWHEVGTSARYFQARLRDLSELARAARALTGDAGEGVVSWG